MITGATRGLGWAMARAMAGAGARVVINGRDAAKAEARVAEKPKDADNDQHPGCSGEKAGPEHVLLHGFHRDGRNHGGAHVVPLGDLVEGDAVHEAAQPQTQNDAW